MKTITRSNWNERGMDIDDKGNYCRVEDVLGFNFNELIEEVNIEETEEIGHITFAERCFNKFKSKIEGT